MTAAKGAVTDHGIFDVLQVTFYFNIVFKNEEGLIETRDRLLAFDWSEGFDPDKFFYQNGDGGTSSFYIKDIRNKIYNQEDLPPLTDEERDFIIGIMRNANEKTNTGDFSGSYKITPIIRLDPPHKSLYLSLRTTFYKHLKRI